MFHANPLAVFADEECGKAWESPSSSQWDVSPLNEDQNKQDQRKRQNKGDANGSHTQTQNTEHHHTQTHNTDQEQYRPNARIEEGWRMAVPKEVGYGLMHTGDTVEVPAHDEMDDRPWMPASPRWLDGMNPGRQPDELFAAEMRIVFLQSVTALVLDRHWEAEGCSTEMEDEVESKRYEHLCRQWHMCH